MRTARHSLERFAVPAVSHAPAAPRPEAIFGLPEMRTGKTSSLRYRVEPLEPRLLLAADWAAGLAPQWSPELDSPPADIDLFAPLPAPGPAAAQSSEPHGVAAELPPALDLEALRRLGEPNSVQPELASFDLAEDAEPSSQPIRHELVVIDADVADREELLADLQSASDGLRHIEVLILDGRRDGIAQISDALTGFENLDALQLISHGTNNAIQLGDTWLTSGSLGSYRDAIAAWGGALADEADLLVYGCNLAAGVEGVALLEGLASLTGADVAASDDLTGSALLGGDWELEYRTGDIETVLGFSAELQQSWSEVLATITLTSYETGSQEAEVKSDQNVGQTFAHVGGGGTYDVNQFALQLRKDAAAPSQSITLSLRESWNGPDLASTVISSDAIGTSMAWHTFDTGSVTLNDGQSYFIRATTDTTAGLVYAAFDDSGTYADGDRLDAAGSPLSAEDYLFRVQEKTGANNAPTAVDDSYTVDEDTPLSSNDSWFDASWLFRQTLSFDNTAQSETLTDFPVLVTLDSSRIDYANTQDNGEDLRFVDGDGTVLAHEIELWDESGISYVWVNVPQVDGATGSDFIWMYYGNASAPDGQDVANVWGTDYKAVYHLDEVAGIHSDSSSNNHDLSNFFGVDQNATGVIDGADDFDGSNDYLQGTGPDAALQITGDLTLEAWINLDSYPGDSMFDSGTDAAVLEFAGTGDTPDQNYLYALIVQNNHDVALGHEAGPGVNHFQDMGVDLSLGQWYQLTAVRDATAMQWNLFINGAPAGSTYSYASNPTDGSGGNLYIGWDHTFFEGIIDEVRVSDTMQSADWIAAQYASQSDTFITYGYTQSAAGVLGNDIDADGDPLTATLVAGPSNAAAFLLNPDGSFTYTPAVHFNGVDSFTYRANDGGADSNVATVTISVDPVNDEPSFTTLGDQGVPEDSGPHTVIGFATPDPGGGVDEAGQTFTYTVSNDNGALFAVAPTIDAGGQLSYALNPNVNGTATVTVSVSDSGGVANGGDDTSPDQTFDITVTAVNNAPTLSGGPFSLTGTDEDTTSTGVQVSSILGGLTTGDLDGDTLGLAVTTAVGNSTWQYSADSTDGSDGTWTDFGPVAANSALLLSNATWVRYDPDTVSGETASLIFHAWDGSTGSASVFGVPSTADPAGGGGTTAFSDTTAQADLLVTDFNDAPTNTLPGLQSIAAGGSVVFNAGTGTEISIADPDAGSGALEVTLRAGGGTLTLVTTTGLSFSTGTGTGDPSMTFTGTLTAINTALDGTTFDADPAFFGFAGVTITTNDQGNSPAPALDDLDAVTIAVGSPEQQLWLTFEDDEGATGNTDIPSFTGGDVVSFGNVTVLEPGVTTGDFAYLFNLDADADDGNTRVGAVHQVSQDMTVGTNSIQLKAGDLLFSTDGNEDIGGVTYSNKDVLLFRPTVSGVYTTGTIFELIDGDDVGLGKVTGVSLVEYDTRVGAMTMRAGEFLIAHDGDGKDLVRFRPGTLGASTAGTLDVLLDGPLVEIDHNIGGVHLVQLDTSLGPTALTAGQILLSLEADDGTVGDLPGQISTERHDVFVIDVTATEIGSGAGASAATAVRLFEGLDESLESGQEDIWGVSLATAQPPGNSAPTLSGGPFTLTGTDEDTTSTGVQVATVLGGLTTGDVDGDTLGLAVTTTAGNSTWQYSTDSTDGSDGTWTNFGPVAANSALLLSNSTWVRYDPDTVSGETASLSFHAWDGSTGSASIAGVPSTAEPAGGGGTTAFSDTTAQANLLVSDVNDAPVLADASPTLTAISEDGFTSAGDSVAAIVVDGSITDPDGAAVESIAITAVDDGNGTWQYSIDNGGTWNTVDDGSLAVDHALLLDGTLTGGATQKLRFVPDPDYNGNAVFTFRAWDMSAGAADTYVDTTSAGGTTPYSSATDTASITVNAVNDEPSVNLIGNQNVLEDSGPHTLAGFAIALPGGGPDEAGQTFSYTVSNDNGGLFAVGPTIDASGTLTYSLNPAANGVATVTVSVTDSGGTTNGGDETSPDQTFDITVTAVNNAPTLSGGPLSLTGTDEDTTSTGVQVSTVLGGLITGDSDGDPLGLAVITAAGNNTWQYSTDSTDGSDGIWTNFGPVAANSALLLSNATWVRYDPDTLSGETASLSFHAWDGSTGSASIAGVPSTADPAGGGGSTAFSDTTAQADLLVSDVNDAPDLADVSPTLTAIAEDDITSAGDSVAAIVVDGSITDPDGAAVESIAITAVDDANGTWQYSTDNGGTWNNVDDGSLAVDHALLLDGSLTGGGTQKLRFVPDPNYNGSAVFTFRAWDMSAGVADTYVDTTSAGGMTPYSSATDTASITVNAVNDEPSVNLIGNQNVLEDSGPHNVAGFAIATPGGGPDEAGQTFSYTVSNDNGGLFAVGPTIDASGQLSYTLNPDVTGTATVTVSVTDSGSTANGGDDTSPDQTFDIVVAPVNDEPSFATLGNQSVAEDSGPHTVVGFATPAPSGGTDEAGQTFSYTVSNDNPGLFASAPTIDTSGTLSYTLNPAANGTATVTVSVTDSGGTANGGDDTSPDQTFDIVVVAAVNTAPTASNLTQSHTYLEDAASVALDDIVVTDADVGDTLTATLTLADTSTGTLSTASGNGESYTPGTGVWTITGTLVQVNAALADVAFIPAANNAVDTSISTHIEDLAGAGPTDGVITLDVTPLNDEPSFATLGNQNVLQDSGSHTVVGFASAAPGGGADEVGQTFSYTLSNDNAALFAIGPAIDAAGTLTYTLNPGVSGAAAVTVSVTDSGGIANGGDDTSPNRTFNIVVSALNTAPAGADASLVVLEDIPHVFTAGDFGFSDSDGHSLQAVGITSLPAAGTLTSNAVPVNAGDRLSALNIAAGNLVFTPDVDANGAGYASFTFQVQDDGDTVNGGVDLDPTPNVIRIAVTPVNDQPSFTTLGTQNVPQNSGAHTVPGFAAAAPGGGADEAGQTLDYALSSDNATLFAVAPAIDASGQLSYTLNPDVSGTATVTVTVVDSGDTANGGDNSAPTQTFDIVVVPAEDETVDPDPALPAIPPPDSRVDPDSGDPDPDESASQATSPDPQPENPGLPEVPRTLRSSGGGVAPLIDGLAVVLPADTGAVIADSLEAVLDGARRDRGPNSPDAPLPVVFDPEPSPNLSQVEVTEGSQSALVISRESVAFGLDRMRDALDEQTGIRRFELTQSTGTVVGLSVGYVSWLLRGGVLLSSVLASLPAWRFIDPLPVFSRTRRRAGDDDEDDQSLEAIVEDGAVENSSTRDVSDDGHLEKASSMPASPG